MICLCRTRHEPNADPRLVWMATVLAAAVFILYVTHI